MIDRLEQYNGIQQRMSIYPHEESRLIGRLLFRKQFIETVFGNAK
jgi:hypothetical protein